MAKYEEDIKKFADMSEKIERINRIQSQKLYKGSLVMMRFCKQCIRKEERKDFETWFLAKLLHRSYEGRGLISFDPLEKKKNELREKRSQLEFSDFADTNTNFKQKRSDISKTVIIFASVPIYDVGGGQRSAQLAKTFHEMGYVVHYIYGFECSEENIPDVFIPAVTHKMIDDVSLGWYKNVLTKSSITIFEIPYVKFKPYLELAKKYHQHTVYEHIDNWDTTLGNLFYDPEVFKNFIEEVDLITVTAKMLGEKIREKTDREYKYLPNAVNINIFEPGKTYECPSDLRIGKGKTLLYFGSLWGEWFDWEKILYLAEHCKDAEINLIGDCSGITDKIGKMPKNIHFLGLKAQTELPKYLQHSDIALLPFKNCEIGKYVSPLKIFEYIAMNKKVLAANLDDIQNYPNVYASDEKEDWLKFLQCEEELADTEVFIAENNWYARCAELIEYFEPENAKKEPAVSVIVLNYNNKKVIERCVKTLLNHNRRYGYEIIVVDNGSTDGSYELLKEKYGDRIRLLKNGENGCSSGRNLGASKAMGEYLMFLDSDQWVISDYWLDSALDLLENNVSIGAVGWAGGWFEPGKTAGPINDYLPNRGLERAENWYRTDIAYLGSGAMLVKRELFHAVEGFDEAYDPTCYEDTDFSLKIRNYGYELALCPYISVMHLPHQTTKSGTSAHKKQMQKNGAYFWEKWYQKNKKLLEYYLN